MNKKKTVVVSAQGKIHLMGEHAVVYGKPALLAAIDKRLTITLTDNATKLRIESQKGKRLMREAVSVVAKYCGVNKEPTITIIVSSTIPMGRHTGSSAALAVATVGALYYYYKKSLDKQIINNLAYEVEKLQHGNPSGGDNSTSTYGGLVWFRKELEFIKTIYKLPFTISDKLSPFYLVDTGKPIENTGDMVAFVGKKVKKNPDTMVKVFADNEQATRDMAIAIKEGDEGLLITTIRKGERTLEKMGVVSRSVQPFIRDIEKKGGAAKILGGGGSKGPVGLLLVYHRKKQTVETVSRKYDYPVYDVALGKGGVRLEG